MRHHLLLPATLGALMLSLTLIGTRPVAAQSMDHDQMHHGAGDTGFAAMQARGRMAMGVDQATSIHHFTDLPDGGRIVLQRDRSDTAGVRAIRAHLLEITRAFAAGDFRTPGFVHGKPVSGVRTMMAKRGAIHYEFHPMSGGGAVEITTSDPAAIAAVHRFLAFQRREHHAGE